MGAYLSNPVTDKEVFEGQGSTLRFGGGAMQGWRRTMEDAHLAVTALNDDPNVAMFGVFDGHGGAEVAKFCQKYLATELQKIDGFHNGSLEESMIQAFHRMDEMLRDKKYAEEIEQLKAKEPAEDEDVDGENEGAIAMDAMEMLKKVFQLRRLVEPSEANSRGESGSRPDEEPVVEAAESRVQAGCTAVVALKRGNELFVANAGDSRGVLSRNGKAIPLSEDHKPAHEVEKNRIIAAGGFLSEIGGVCRVNGNLNLSRAIGDLKYKTNVELPAKDQIITAQPDVRRITLTPEDKFFVLACDGVWDVMSNQEVVDFVGERLDKNRTPSQASCELLDRCLAIDPKEARGVGCDNMTVVVIQLSLPSSSDSASQQQQA